MLDVHPPHHPTHTWKDFFIHIATISVGLLIAVGLEQTVEYIHHQRQAHQLEQDLHAETLRNLHIAMDNVENSEGRVDEMAMQYRELRDAAHQHRTPSLSPVKGKDLSVRGAVAAWTVALQNGTVELLPHAEAQRYARVYRLAQQMSEALDADNVSARAYRSATTPATFDADLGTGSFVDRHMEASSLDAEQLRAISQNLAAMIQSTKEFIRYNVFFYGMEWACSQGMNSDQELVRILYDASAVYDGGGKAALLAKYPLPEEVQPTEDNKHAGGASAAPPHATATNKGSDVRS